MKIEDKHCKYCNRTQTVAHFYKDKHKPDGLTVRCKSCIAPRNKEYGRVNKESRKKYAEQWYQENKERKLAKSKEWAKSNRGRKNACWMKRRMLKIIQTPNLEAEEEALIGSLYIMARILSNSCGEKFHVDHIKPISRGGTHELANLQILSAEDNLRKGSSWNDKEVIL